MAMGNRTEVNFRNLSLPQSAGLPSVVDTQSNHEIFCTNEEDLARVDAWYCKHALSDLRHEKGAAAVYTYRAPRAFEFSPLPCAIILTPLTTRAGPIRLTFFEIAASAHNILVTCKRYKEGGMDRLSSDWYLTVGGGVVNSTREVAQN